MSAIGIFCLGIGSAILAGIIISRMRASGPVCIFFALSPIYASSALIFLHPRFVGVDDVAIALYPVGILLSLAWQVVWPAIENLSDKLTGVITVTAWLILTAATFYLFLKVVLGGMAGFALYS